jgi:amino acid efflux transporter
MTWGVVMSPHNVYYPTKLRKSLNIGRSISLVIGSVLGSGLMILPGLAYNQVGICSFYSWLGVGLIMMPFLYIFMIIMIEHPSAGGLVNVTYLLLGDKIGLFITYLIIFSLVLLVPIVGIIGANYICYLLNINNNLNILIAWFLLFFLRL